VALGLFSFAAAVVAGCRGEASKPAAAPASTPAKSQASAPVDAAPITVEVVDRAGYDQAIAKHRGKVVLVDFWATWCGPCKEAFPHTVELSRRFAADGLAVVSCSLDEFDESNESEVRAEVLDFLKDQGATFNNLLAKPGPSGDAFEEFQILGGTIPQFKLYDRDGKLYKNFYFDDQTGASYTPKDVDDAVRKLLQKS
jgi:thiol-disulfide isomerase/thioredoxin